MFDYKQRPTTNEYRSGWDKIFGEEESEEDEDETYNEDTEE
jgi:hypothetical protein